MGIKRLMIDKIILKYNRGLFTLLDILVLEGLLEFEEETITDLYYIGDNVTVNLINELISRTNMKIEFN